MTAIMDYEYDDNLPCTVTTSGESGDLVQLGSEIVGVLQNDSDSDGNNTVKLKGVATFTVEAVDASGNSAVDNYDKIYYTSGDDPPLNKKNTGVAFGYAYDPDEASGTELISSGGSSSIMVMFPVV